MKFRVEVDYNWECPLATFLGDLDKYKGKLLEWVTEGPGGGNPQLFIGFETREEAIEFLKFHDEESDLEWLEGRVEEIDPA